MAVVLSFILMMTIAMTIMIAMKMMIVIIEVAETVEIEVVGHITETPTAIVATAIHIMVMEATTDIHTVLTEAMEGMAVVILNTEAMEVISVDKNLFSKLNNYNHYIFCILFLNLKTKPSEQNINLNLSDKTYSHLF